MAKSSHYEMKGLRFIAAGYFLLAAMLFAMQVCRIFWTSTILEIGSIGVDLVAWILIWRGFRSIKGEDRQFGRAHNVSMIAIVLILLQLAFTIRNVLAGMESGAFIDVSVLFFWFMAVVAMIYTFIKVLQGLGTLMNKVSPNHPDTRKCTRRTGWIVGVILVLVLLFVQVVALFSPIVQYIGVGVLGLVGLLSQLYVCRLLLNGYKEIHGKPRKYSNTRTETGDETKVISRSELFAREKKSEARKRTLSRRGRKALKDDSEEAGSEDVESEESGSGKMKSEENGSGKEKSESAGSGLRGGDAHADFRSEDAGNSGVKSEPEDTQTRGIEVSEDEETEPRLHRRRGRQFKK